MNVGSTNGLTVMKKTILTPVEYSAVEDRRPYAKASEQGKSEQDKIEMSSHGMIISRLQDLISTVPDIRESRVKEALLALGSGAYDYIKAEHIAEKLITNSL